jgi:hypothetical protein
VGCCGWLLSIRSMIVEWSIQYSLLFVFLLFNPVCSLVSSGLGRSVVDVLGINRQVNKSSRNKRVCWFVVVLGGVGRESVCVDISLTQEPAGYCMLDRNSNISR